MNTSIPLTPHPGMTDPIICKSQPAQDCRMETTRGFLFSSSQSCPRGWGSAVGHPLPAPRTGGPRFPAHGPSRRLTTSPQPRSLLQAAGQISLTSWCPGLQLPYLGLFLSILVPNLLVVFLARKFYIKIKMIFN